MALRKKVKVSEEALRQAMIALKTGAEENPFIESDDLTDAWELLKKQHMDALSKLSSVAQGRRLQNVLRTKIQGLLQHCNAEGASDIAIEMRNMLKKTYAY